MSTRGRGQVNMVDANNNYAKRIKITTFPNTTDNTTKHNIVRQVSNSLLTNVYVTINLSSLTSVE